MRLKQPLQERVCIPATLFGRFAKPRLNTSLGTDMRLDEIKQASAEERRVARLKDNAKVAKDKAKQLTTQAKVSADQLKMQKSRQQLTLPRTSTSIQTIKPHA